MNDNKNDAVDAALYRDGMARYAGHVQLVTTQWQGKRRGVTITAACSVSDNPPTVLICLNSSNPKNGIFRDSGTFTLNALAAHQKDLAVAFSGLSGLAEEERFALARWDRLATGAPVLVDAAVAFDCRIADIKEMSTHMVIFGSVEAVTLGPDPSALLYHERAFRDIPLVGEPG